MVVVLTLLATLFLDRHSQISSRRAPKEQIVLWLAEIKIAVELGSAQHQT
jgi:hypothetical protein